ncbi:MAG: hypothetical protein H0V35_14420 [Nitrospira sp.]|nr:hypothetical protein [Nitrospira sp.]
MIVMMWSCLKGYVPCAKVGDFATRHLLQHMTIDTEERIDGIETQLRTFDQVDWRCI